MPAAEPSWKRGALRAADEPPTKHRLPSAWVAAFFCGVVLTARCWQRLRAPNLYAEDGPLFFTEAYAYGARSLVLGYAGYLHLGPRIIAWLATFLPVAAFALVCTLTSLGSWVVVCCTPLRADYRWLVAATLLRAGACLALCLAPGLYEVLGNLANLHNVWMVWLGLRLLRAPNARLQLADWLFVVLALGSDGAAFVWLPPLLVRLACLLDPPPGAHHSSLAARARRAWTHHADDVVLLLFMLLSTACHTLVLRSSLSVHDSQIGTLALTDLLAASAYVCAERFVVHPWGGAEAAASLGHCWPGVGLALLLLVAVGLAVYPRRRPQVLVLGAAMFSVLGLYLLTIGFRAGALATFLDHPAAFFRIRYTLVAFPFAVLGWSVAADTLWRWRPVGPTLGLLFSFLCLDSRQSFDLGQPPGAREDWYGSAAIIQQAIDEKRCTILRLPCTPVGWSFTYRSPQKWCGASKPVEAPTP